MESKKIYWWGENGSLTSQTTPTKLNWKEKSPEVHQNQNLKPLRLQSTWCKSMSLMYVTLADTSKVTTTYRTKQKVLNGVSSTWAE